MAIKQINNLDIEPALNEVERINKSIDFLGSALVEYPSEGGLKETATILFCLSSNVQNALDEIKRISGLE